ncbi:8-oxo-dGTP diphosphatase [Loktanella sp. PT4BL]|jgi:8-oxo-dGTP diphosphatase|uniref:NUDIX hydrolase n=1 Tax=Loktanella sp. PT4BL TaxID=2135611 RepID=UPI000D75DA87|nr:NUDIX hydrolase [Loktanella sp. PT4BL]PXW71967.1 8-oxo-dGTP diphosphatase [Loktanella sp. PT4BL]
MIRRYGEVPQNGQRYKLRPGVYAILPRAGKLLCTYQGDPHYEVQLPGGGIDHGEHPLNALHREVFEETGWRITAPRKLGAFRRFTFMPEYDLWAEKLCHIYLARPVRPHGPPSEPGHMALWLSVDEALTELYNDGDADFVARFAS